MNNLIFTGKITAALSFIVGTILLSLFFYFNESNTLPIIGLYFIVIAFVINVIIFLILIISAGFNIKYRFELLKIAGIMLINIPVAISYFFLITQLIKIRL